MRSIPPPELPSIPRRPLFGCCWWLLLIPAPVLDTFEVSLSDPEPDAERFRLPRSMDPPRRLLEIPPPAIPLGEVACSLPLWPGKERQWGIELRSICKLWWEWRLWRERG